MTLTVLVIFMVVVAVVLLIPKTRQKAVGICVAAIGLDARKRENKDKILQLMRERSRVPDGEPSAFAKATADKGEVNNSDIREALGVSSSSVARYMDELEKEGKVEQVGDTGRNVTYRLK